MGKIHFVRLPMVIFHKNEMNCWREPRVFRWYCLVIKTEIKRTGFELTYQLLNMKKDYWFRKKNQSCRDESRVSAEGRFISFNLLHPSSGLVFYCWFRYQFNNTTTNFSLHFHEHLILTLPIGNIKHGHVSDGSVFLQYGKYSTHCTCFS